MIKNNADVNIISYGFYIFNFNEKTALHYAAWSGNVKICNLLLENNADINQVDNSIFKT